MRPEIEALIAIVHNNPDPARVRELSEEVRTAAAVAFPLAPGEEGYFSGWCERVVYAFEGSVDDAMRVKRRLGPDWRVSNLAESSDGLWWCCVEKGPLKDERGEVLEPGRSGEACDRPLMAHALLLASLRAMQEF